MVEQAPYAAQTSNIECAIRVAGAQIVLKLQFVFEQLQAQNLAFQQQPFFACIQFRFIHGRSPEPMGDAQWFEPAVLARLRFANPL